MSFKEVLGLEVWGDHAHYRKRFTTSSPLTYGVPPRTAVAGMLGAIQGLPRTGEDNYHRVFSRGNSRIAVVNRPREETGKQRLNLNLLKLDDDTGKTNRLKKLGKAPDELRRSQVPFEVVRAPRYRIYFAVAEERMDKFEEFLRAGKSFYTPCLGISEYLADYEFLGRFDISEGSGETGVDSVLNHDRYDIKFEPGEDEKRKKYVVENTSLFMNENRVVQDFAEVIYEENGRPVRKTSGSHYVVSNGDTITFLQ
jgi:CRISPR-associated protein Cas5h